MKHLSKLTIGLAVYIIVSATFALPVMSLINRIFGEEKVRLAAFLLFVLVVLAYTVFLYYRHLPFYKIGISLFLFGLSFFLMLCQEYFSEKLHVIEYGILGYFGLRDIRGNHKHVLSSVYSYFHDIAHALCFVALISALDEGFQWVLPNRFFELKDMATNIIAGFFGMIQCVMYKFNRLLSCLNTR